MDQHTAHTLNIGRRIAELRKERGWTQQELAGRSGMSARYVGHLETGFRRPGLLTLMRLATTFEVSLDTLAAEEPAQLAS